MIPSTFIIAQYRNRGLFPERQHPLIKEPAYTEIICANGPEIRILKMPETQRLDYKGFSDRFFFRYIKSHKNLKKKFFCEAFC